jgi:putative ABC transport system substrate-binding protein
MSPDFTAKTLELLLSVVPGASRVAVLISANPATASLIRPIRALAQTLGVEILPVTWKSPADLDEAFEKIGAENCDGLIVLADPNINRRIFELAAKTRVPAIYQRGVFVRMGGLLSYSPDDVDLMRRGAVYVDRILKGAAPAELPVEQPTKFELLVNLKTAKSLGLTIPESILVRANEVIE